MPRKTLPPTSTYIPQHTGYTYPCFLVCPCLEGPQQRKKRFPKFPLGRKNASELFLKNSSLAEKNANTEVFRKKPGFSEVFRGFRGFSFSLKKFFPRGLSEEPAGHPHPPSPPNPFATAAAMRTSVPPAWVGHPGTNVLDVKVAHRGGAPRRRTEAHTLIALGCLMETL